MQEVGDDDERIERHGARHAVLERLGAISEPFSGTHRLVAL
jgi:hypothetical protein